MCGIVGARDDWLRRHGLSPAAAMQGAVDELRWRGPDGAGVARCGSWWLGCARLAISRADSGQPVVRRGGRFACVMNGAVTNARELWAKWRPGIERREPLPNDAWLPLLAVEAGRPLGELRGHRAFAVVDAENDEIVIGRDRYGEKPLLCLFEDDELVAFASTSQALAQLGARLGIADEQVAEWFRYGWHEDCEYPATPGSHAVEHSWRPLRSGPGGVSRPAEDRNRSAALGDRDLRRELVASVARCIDTGVPVGLSLSGGLDSSCLALALAELGARPPAFQFCAHGAPTHERDAARAAAATAGLPLHEVSGGPELLDELPRLTRLAGQPLGDPSILAVHAVARRAAENGVKVMLGGEGADELMLGYRRHRLLARLPRLPGRRLLRRLLRPLFDGWSMRYAARAARALTATDPIHALLAVTPPAFAREVLAPDIAAQPCWQHEGFLHPESELLLLNQTVDVAQYLARDLLPKLDVALMAAGIEGRCPFLEGDLRLEPSRRQLGKRALREAFADRLPAAVADLPKRGFGLPLDAWFRGDTPWLDVLREPRSRERRHLCPGGMQRAIDVHRSGRAELGHSLYLLLAFELYLRSIEGRDGADSPSS